MYGALSARMNIGASVISIDVLGLLNIIILQV